MCFRSILFLMSSELNFIKWVRCFEQNYNEWMIFFASFYWLWGFLLKILKSKETLMFTGACGWIKKKIMPEISSKKTKNKNDKKNPKEIWHFESFILWSKFPWTAFGRFSQCFFLIFCHRPTVVANSVTRPQNTKISKSWWGHSYCPVSTAAAKYWQWHPLQLRIYTNRYQMFQTNLTSIDFLIFFKIICTGL